MTQIHSLFAGDEMNMDRAQVARALGLCNVAQVGPCAFSSTVHEQSFLSEKCMLPVGLGTQSVTLLVCLGCIPTHRRCVFRYQYQCHPKA
jgi:hypothetical protein